MEPTTPNSSSNNNGFFSSFDSNKSLGENNFLQLDEISCFTTSQNNMMTVSSQSFEENTFQTEQNIAVLQSILSCTEEIQFDSEMEDRIFSWLDTMNIHISSPGKERRNTVNLSGRQKSSLLSKRKQSTMN